MEVLGKEIIWYAQCLLVILSFHITLVQCKKDCWMKFEENQYFNAMDELNGKYGEIIKSFHDSAKPGDKTLDKDMLVIILKNRGMAERAVHAARGMKSEIPAGINLGGYCMMTIRRSVLFFHRMKLRNNTVFRVVNLKNDLANLQLKTQIHLNDLHLFGSYDSSITAKPGYLYYEPTYGQMEILLKNVTYSMDGRYRLLKNRLNIEMVISEINIEDVLVMYRNKNSTLKIKLHKSNIDVFTERLKLDLDKWLKDYFNDYLMYFAVTEDPEFEKYYQEKNKILNNYTGKVIDLVINRISQFKATAVQLPVFTINDSIDKEITLREGVLRGLDSIYRRSITTEAKENSIHNIDTIVGFSNLKLSYRYDAILKAGFPPVKGSLILTADDLTAHMRLAMIKSPQSTDLTFKYLEQTKPESLTIEGPANRVISNFKHLLERHIIALMVNTLILNINLLSTLDRCVPLFLPYNNGSSEAPNNEVDPQGDSSKFDNNATTKLPNETGYHVVGVKEDANVINGQDSDNYKPLTLADSSENENDDLSSNTKQRRAKIPLKKKNNKIAFKRNIKRNKRY